MDLIESVTSIFTLIGDWIVKQLGIVQSVFWHPSTGEVTFLGALALCGLGISVIFLLIRVIQNFLHFRG